MAKKADAWKEYREAAMLDMMLTTLPKVRLFLSIYLNDVWYFPKDIFPSGNFPWVFSQVATSQMCKFPSSSFPKVRHSKAPQTRTCQGGQGLRLRQTCEVATWENTLGKLPLG